VSLQEHLSRVTARYEELQHLMGESGVSGDEYTRLSKEFSDLAPINAAIEALQAAEREAGDLAQMIADADIDSDMRAMAEEEFTALKEKIPDLERHVKLMIEMQSWKCAPVRGATKQRCLPLICFVCTSVMQIAWAGNLR